jgi:hypothetical protein
MQSRALIVAASLGLAMSAGAIQVRAAQIVWSGLVVAENVSQPSPIPSELSSLEQTLKELFGYNQFQIIAQSRKPLKTGEEDWLASSKYFALHVEAQGESEAGYAVNLKLYKEKELLLETDTKLSKKSPLVIKGPLVGNGQLLLVLMVESGASTGQRRVQHQSNQFVTAWRHFSHAVRDLLP